MAQVFNLSILDGCADTREIPHVLGHNRLDSENLNSKKERRRERGKRERERKEERKEGRKKNSCKLNTKHVTKIFFSVLSRSQLTKNYLLSSIYNISQLKRNETT